jgi:hypothetical protein
MGCSGTSTVTEVIVNQPLLEAALIYNPQPSSSQVKLTAVVKNEANKEPLKNAGVVFEVFNFAGVSVFKSKEVYSSSTGEATALVTLSEGLYKVVIKTVNGCAEAVSYLPVYDPAVRFTTGGVRINSPAVDQTLYPTYI